MGHFFWPVTCTHMGKQLNPQPSHPGKVGGKSPPPPGGISIHTPQTFKYHIWFMHHVLITKCLKNIYFEEIAFIRCNKAARYLLC